MRFARQLVRTFSQHVSSKGGAQSAHAPKDPLSSVKGLTNDCVRVPNEPVGPGAKSDGAYKVPEYFSYNTMSYHHAEVEMQKYRIPQPNANRQ